MITTAISKSLTTTSVGFKCSKGDGYYASPGCTGFYQCIYSGTLVTNVILCPAGLLFDTKLNVCNWASIVLCNV